jgi:hypothetical protein
MCDSFYVLEGTSPEEVGRIAAERDMIVLE